MKFFVPCTDSREDADACWFAIRDWLARELGLETTGRRISALVCAIDGVDHVTAVARETPYGDVVVAILESEGLGLFYVCTYQHGVFEGGPYPLKLNEDWRVIEFEKDMEGCGWA